RLTTQMADLVNETLKPMGVMVVIEAEHLCMSMRGVKRPHNKVVTSALHGVFRENRVTRQEALELFK
ncbi:MAG: GTP cyclohydrolase I, partial [Desulfobacterales bacterium]|nr:GTP cyclohydrolase I [Desulfobacterales bacterium]